MESKTQKLNAYLIVCAVLLLALGIIVSFGITLYLTSQGKEKRARFDKGQMHLAEQNDWPQPIKSVHDMLKNAGADTSTFEVSHLPKNGDPRVMRDAMACRVQLDKRFLNTVITEKDLRAVTEDEGVSWNHEVHHRTWWSDSLVSAEYYASRTFVDGKAGPHFLVAYRPDIQTAYLIYKPELSDLQDMERINLVENSEWPRWVSDVHDAMAATSGAEMSTFEVTIALEGKWNKSGQDAFLSRVKIDNASWKTIVADLELQSTNASVARTWRKWLVNFWKRKDWWPYHTKFIEYQASPNYFAGTGGSHLLTAYDTKSEMAFLVFAPE